MRLATALGGKCEIGGGWKYIFGVWYQRPARPPTRVCMTASKGQNLHTSSHNTTPAREKVGVQNHDVARPRVSGMSTEVDRGDRTSRGMEQLTVTEGDDSMILLVDISRSGSRVSLHIQERVSWCRRKYWFDNIKGMMMH